jgi:hypothetical protein
MFNTMNKANNCPVGENLPDLVTLAAAPFPIQQLLHKEQLSMLEAPPTLARFPSEICELGWAKNSIPSSPNVPAR